MIAQLLYYYGRALHSSEGIQLVREQVGGYGWQRIAIQKSASDVELMSKNVLETNQLLKS